MGNFKESVCSSSIRFDEDKRGDSRWCPVSGAGGLSLDSKKYRDAGDWGKTPTPRSYISGEDRDWLILDWLDAV